ncbi:uncharacterized protein AMSG_11374 [Thecamonas trahens ATCC 50062]|uniref:Uncharacterized protein n=1 Tax=Thecamonas trahens ATCC 50062 TaxID=461836 RepID=A0A0L0DWK2_THETB|nr:hypothetical protein AMSG_11374 [Thecamonas trahens ATCC 50062]KNC55908.1 hypothetical protein AMSG_11374 [Thecamonas trahens ATCC 50062]|eukprot:XP_013752727.1 hypothetical protein AMSG_11374 [Thecamonas trahens ATCC 50062]
MGRDEEEESLPKLTPELWSAVIASDALTSQVSDPRLQELIRSIDSAPDREAALNATARNDPDFAAFIDTLLSVLDDASTQA